MKKFKSPFLVITILAAIATIAAVIFINRRYKTVIVDIPKFDHTAINSYPDQNTSPVTPRGETNTQNLVPKTMALKVPFTPQAPTANWDELHNESCEEASAIMVAEYFSGNKNIQLDPELVKGQLKKITQWEKQKFGYYLDINAEEISVLLKEFYGLNAKVVTNYTADGLKKELADGHLVLLLANGQELHNPNYRRPGPPYHVLVLKGYTGDNFVTNDPGTRKGLNYLYTFETLYTAGGDWSHSINAVDQGTKTAVIVWK